MTVPLALQIQRLGGFSEQVLVLLRIAELREPGGYSRPGVIGELFKALRLPPPQNPRQHLTQLRDKRFAMQPAAGEWATTPEGKEELRRLMGETSVTELAALVPEYGEPIFAGAAHHLLPPEIAPAKFQHGIARFLDESPFDSNVFLMARYPRADDGYSLQPTIDKCRGLCTELGLSGHVASDRAVDDELFPNVGTYLWSCRYGIAILEDRIDRGLNYNVVLEAGAMLMTGRRCLLLKDVSAPVLPVDLLSHIHAEIDLDSLDSVEAAVREWIVSDLNLG